MVSDVNFVLKRRKHFVYESVQPRIKLGNGDVVWAKEKGTIVVKTRKSTKFINNVLYIPELDQNLLSVAQMLRNDYEVSFKNNCCFIADIHGSEVAKIKMNGNSFYLKLDAITTKKRGSLQWIFATSKIRCKFCN